jgi:hypothetical protein
MQDLKSDGVVLPWTEVEIYIRAPGKRTHSLRMAISDYEVAMIGRGQQHAWADYAARHITEALVRAVRDVAGN